MQVIAGDVGGTKTLLARCEVSGASVRVLHAERVESRGYARFEDLLRAVAPALGEAEAEAVCLGVAGPVDDDRCRATNLPWTLDARDIAATLGLARGRLVNDFFAAAAGVEALTAESVVTLQPGAPRDDAPRVVIGAGTGLGEALLVPVDGRWVCVPGEGGHADFAPRTPREQRLAARLAASYGRVSWERVVSGLGLADLYAFLRDDEGLAESPGVAAAMRGGDVGAVIGARALAGDDPLCAETVALFLGAYGAEAGNAALRSLARGGVYLAGGIAAKLLPLMQNGLFLGAFCDKGRMADLARMMPVHVVTDEALGLKGAARVAARMVSPGA